MKRLWFGIGILVLLLCIGIGVTIAMDRHHRNISENMQAAAAAVQSEDWESAAAYAGSAESKWNAWRHFAASFADHEPLEQMDSLFAELKVYENMTMASDYAAVCTHLSELARAIGESHALNWWNLL